ncbi:MAG: hypothetical protein JO001_05905 [Alphaproteobacteria bacterium]|nr:hypothetical protein [Alphaproteobacteria bacterium]
MTFLATAHNGQLDFGSDFNQQRLRLYLSDHEGKQLRLDEIKTVRSLSQNRYYWVYLGIIERETGNNADDLHEYLKRKLLPPRFVEVLGQEIRLPASTTGLSKADFGDYLDKIASLSGVPLPDPQLAGYLQH